MNRNELIKIKEGSAEFFSYDREIDTVPSKSMPTFYNKKMVVNRDILNLAVIAYKKIYNPKYIIFVDSMAATGITAIRVLKEVNGLNKIYINDINPIAVKLIQENLRLNQLEKIAAKIQITNKDANLLFTELSQASEISERKPPNIISIDPFGTPNRYIDSAVKAITRKNGLLAITATDTAVLFGVRQKSCIRKYFSKPLHTEYGKEVGARILIHFISRIANINNLGIIPLLTFYHGHFIRVFAVTLKNKNLIAKFFKNYGYILHCNNCGNRKIISTKLSDIEIKCHECEAETKMEHGGPLWIGPLHDELFLNTLLEINSERDLPEKKLINLILNLAKEELRMPYTYYNIHKLCKTLRSSAIPKIQLILDTLRSLGYQASRTHFDFLGIKTDASLLDLKNIIKNINK
ncbi:MAG: tRNA (guanine(10)-N(2))-dimethyltransferase [Promethearchaeota archaeon]